MAQSGAARPSELDAVVVGAIVVDPAIGVLKADIGVKDGRITGIGRAGSPAISDGINDLVIGAHGAALRLRADRYARGRRRPRPRSART